MERVIKDHPISETADLIEKRKEMTKETWIRNVMRIHPEKTREETEALYVKLLENEPVIGSNGLTDPGPK